MVVTGASNQEIAHQLVISVNTVKVHMRNIFEKLNVQSRTEATLRAIQEGLVTVADNDTPAADDEPETAPPVTKTYLLNANPPLVLPKWQQIYLLLAALLALLVVLLPMWPGKSQRVAPDLPVIYAQPTAPAPPAQPGGNSSRWVSHTSMPTGRAGLALVAFEGQIYAIGGVRENNRATRSVEIFDPATNSWKEGATSPIAAANITGAVLNNQIYVPGGCTNDGKAVRDMAIYTPKTDSWTQGQPLPEPRCGYGLVSHHDKLYLFGGWNGQAFEDTIFIFSPEQNEWEIAEHKMPRPVGYMGAAAVDDTIYIVGGYDGQEEFNQTYAFNPETGRWREKAPLQEKRGGLGLISSSGKLYAIGGGWEHALSTSEKYDPQTDTWSSFETPYTSRWRNLGLTVIDTKLYAVGGWDDTEQKFVDSVVSYQFLFQLFLPISGVKEQ